MTKKIMRAAVVAFALTVLLAVSSFAAYTVNIDGTVNGLADGVDYTYAKYDFAAEAWGEFADLTADSTLTPGVWGIKAGENDAETVFVSGAENGEITFWNTEANTPAYNNAGQGDYFLPGKWNVSKNSAARTVAFYDGKTVASVCIYLQKNKFLVQVDSTTQETVKVGEETYPLFTIDGAKYYLKEEAYYAVADNALYEGEAEAQAVYKKTWVNSTPLIGEDNKLQEVVVRYGFTEGQIVPAKDVISIPNTTLVIVTGGVALNNGHTLSDLKGTMTFVVKTPDVEGYQRYVTEFDAGSVGNSIAAPAEMADADGYLVAFEYAPYANTPDDIFSGANDTAAEVYGHYYLKRGTNLINYNAHLIPGPTGLVNGFGTIGGLDPNKSYQVASATISTDGRDIALGDWTDFDPDSRTLTGLYAVREVYGDIATDYSFAYSYGSYPDRQLLGGLNEKGAVLVKEGTNFTPGHYSGHYITYKTSVDWQIMSHGQVDSSYMLASMNAQKAYDALVATGTATDAELAAAKTTLDEKNTALINKINAIVLRYTLDKSEILPVGEVNSFRVKAKQNNGFFTLKSDYQSKVVAFVANANGEIETYEQIFTQPFKATDAELIFDIDFASFLPEEGYLVAFELYPCTNVTLDTFGKVTAQYSFRFYTTVNPGEYSIDRPEELPIIEEKPEGLKYDAVNKIISGLDEDERYEYAVFSLNGIAPEDWFVVPAGAKSIDISDLEGMIAVRYMGDGITVSGSDEVYFHVPGAGYENILHTTDIVGTAGSNKDITISVPVVKAALYDGQRVEFEEGTWVGITLNTSLAREYSFAPLTLGTTSTPISLTLGKAIKTAQTELDALGADASADAIAAAQAKLAAAQKAAADRNAQIYYSYAYEPDEIIPMDDFVSFRFQPKTRQTGLKANGQVYTKFVFKVIDENNELVDRVVLKPVTFGYNGELTITKEDFTDTTGYIVGMVIYPFGEINGTYAYNGDINGDYMVILFTDGYKATRSLPHAEMTKLYENDGVVTGFDPAYAYEYAAYNMTGAVGEWADVEGDSFALTNTGLTAIRVKTDNVNYNYSDPQIFYLAGKYTDRKAISETKEDGSVIYTATSEFITGTYTGTRISYMNDPLVARAGAHIHLDQQVGGLNSPDEAEMLWLLTHTKEEAQAALDAEEAKASQYPGAEGANNSYYPARLQGVIDSFYADETRDVEAELAALRADIAEMYKGSYVRYAYTANEIVPVDELESISFYNKSRQGAIVFYTKSAANFYVMDENGVVTPYQWKSDLYYNNYYSEHIHTINVQEEVDLPETGWIVAIEFIPFAEVYPETINGVSYTKLAFKSQAFAFEQNHVNMGFYYNDYEVYAPKIATPDITFADGKFTGLAADKTYAYGRFTADGIELTEVSNVTEVETSGTGVWGIKEISTDPDYADSLFFVGYNKDLTTARDSILHLVDFTKTNGTVVKVPAIASAGGWQTGAAPIFNEATWTGYSLNNNLVNHGFSNLILGTTSCTIGGGDIIAKIRNAKSDAELEAAIDNAEKALASIYYSYEYTAEEVIPMNEFISWSFKVSERQGSLVVKEGSLQTKFIFRVATENGVVDRVVYKDAVLAGGGTIHNITLGDFEETDGYIVGIVIYPYGHCPEGTVIGDDGQSPAGSKTPISEDLNVTLIDDYTVIPAVIVPAETPVLTLGVVNADITIANYNPSLKYVYSCDGGETWVEFAGKSIRATKASTEYVVKALANDFYEESEVSEAVVSPALTVVGTSLVLDGQIGLKVYLDIDMDLVSDVSYTTTKVNNDFKDVDAAQYRQHNYVNFERSSNWMTAITLDEESGLYYTIIYVPAKDLDNTYIETDIGITLKSDPNTRIKVGNVTTYFTKYIAQAKELAAAGNEEFVAALPLVEALETYIGYADNYFNKGTDAAYASTASTAGIEAATRTNTTLEGVEFYGTSLLLEDQVTIRHYFTVNDLTAFDAAYAVEGMYGMKGNFIYFDITDISAQDIGKAQTLTIKDDADNTVYEITYSAANYIVNMMADDDANLVSLVNAMYDYYLAAVDYIK